jgi:CheY-like chemotaxis protein
LIGGHGVPKKSRAQSLLLWTITRPFAVSSAPYWNTGYEICGEAEDGVQAIDSAKELKRDLILLDVCLPRLGGPQVASVLKRVLPKTRIILFTLFDEAISSTLAAAIGADLVLSKTEGTKKLLFVKIDTSNGFAAISEMGAIENHDRSDKRNITAHGKIVESRYVAGNGTGGPPRPGRCDCKRGHGKGSRETFQVVLTPPPSFPLSGNPISLPYRKVDNRL